MIFVAVVAAAGFIGLNASGALTPHHNVAGTFELIDTKADFPSIQVVGGSCKGTGGYSDLGPGTPVTLKDGEGKVLGATTLGNGSGSTRDCLFTFSFASVPEASFYSLEVGKRGELTYSLADMQSRSWAIGGTIGS